MGKLIGVLVTLAIIIVIFILMRRGWNSRKARQDDIAEPAAVPDGRELELVADGQYVATTTAGEPLDRIAVHSLGIRTGASIEVGPAGIAFRRDGCPDFFIPRSDLRTVQTADGMVGKFVESGGLVVITWRLGALSVDTGFRTRYAAEKQPLIESISRLEAS